MSLRNLLLRLAPFAGAFFLATTIVRLSLAVRAWLDTGDWPAALPRAFAIGLWFDIAVFGCFALPLVVWWAVLPARRHGGRLDRFATRLGFFLFLVLTGFTAIGEELFWSEFAARYNFIAVDYLVYTHEVIGNIRESYPVGLLLGGLAAICLAITWGARHSLVPPAETAGLGRRLAAAALVAAMVGVAQAATRIEWAEAGRDALADEVAKNGTYALFHAFWNNEIDYERFYRTLPAEETASRVHNLLAGPNQRFENATPDDDTRLTVARSRTGPLRKNVVIVVMESMSAEYMGHFGNRADLTPSLDRLADEGLLFADAYATGTRTVRGLEAVALSVPPTPGQSILRRPDNGNLYSIGSVFADLGYDRRFIYGGYGYFDNMNAFFAANGFETVDRSDLGADEIRFANVWGVSDQDLFARVLKEGDRSAAAGRPFLSIVMTTSNHRPYTFPAGEIDAPQKVKTSGVRYADHAIGRFVEAARDRPWFSETVFVFVADHTAGSAGKVDLALSKYRIPMIIWAPGFVPPQRRDGAVSQIDLAPTLLELLGVDYRSRFYGRDVLAEPDRDGPVYVSTYQKVALVRGDATAILEPNRKVTGILAGRPVPEADLPAGLVADAAAVYHYASRWREHSRWIRALDGAAALR